MSDGSFSGEDKPRGIYRKGECSPLRVICVSMDENILEIPLGNGCPHKEWTDHHGPINWWSNCKSNWTHIRLGDLLLKVEAENFVVFFDITTREPIAFAWTDEEPYVCDLFDGLA